MDAGDEREGAEAIGSSAVWQIGLVVRDIEKTSRAFADLLGVEVPDWFLQTPEIARPRYQGKPADTQNKIAFFQLGHVELELIEPIGGPSAFQDFLQAHGEGLQHICFEIKDMQKHIGIMQRKGMPLVQNGEFPGGCWACFDSVERLGLVVEFVEKFSE